VNELEADSHKDGGAGGGENAVGLAKGAVVSVTPRASGGREIGFGNAVCTGVELPLGAIIGTNEAVAPSPAAGSGSNDVSAATAVSMRTNAAPRIRSTSHRFADAGRKPGAVFDRTRKITAQVRS
jgi:hypothetical protein